jgi:hypothetical protein
MHFPSLDNSPHDVVVSHIQQGNPQRTVNSLALLEAGTILFENIKNGLYQLLTLDKRRKQKHRLYALCPKKGNLRIGFGFIYI